MGNPFSQPFSHLSKYASFDDIFGEAGRVFAARKAYNRQTDFNTEMWYLAGDVMNAGFSVLRGMTKEQIARAMGNFVSNMFN
jgi:hypothetical protein